MPTTLGKKINALRKLKSFTLQELAEKVDSSKSYIWEIENKEVAKPSAEILTKIARALDVTTEFLVTDSQAEPANEQDKAFFRKYEALDDTVKSQLRKFLDVLDSKDN